MASESHDASIEQTNVSDMKQNVNVLGMNTVPIIDAFLTLNMFEHEDVIRVAHLT